MIEFLVAGKIINRAAASESLVVRTENNARYSCVYGGSRTHHARLESNVHRAACKVPPSQFFRSLANCENFGVSGGIARFFALVVRLGDNFVVLVRYNAAHGNVAAGKAFQAFFNCRPYEFTVGFFRDIVHRNIMSGKSRLRA